MRRNVLKISRIGFIVVLLTSVAAAIAARAQNSQSATFDDTARYLAGMQTSANSPLVLLTQDPTTKQHTAYFDTAFGNLEPKLSRIRAWSAANLNAQIGRAHV